MSLFLWLWIWIAQAGELEDVRVFIGENHARILLVASELEGEVSSRSSPPLGSAPARVVVYLPGLTVSESLRAQARGGSTVKLPIEEGDLHKVQITPVAGQLQVTVDLQVKQQVTLRQIGEDAILLDLRREGADEDRSLPSPEVLHNWLSGLPLKREASLPERTRPRIVLDPGHGGEHPGATGVSGTAEADFCLVFAQRVARELRQRLDAEVILTRSDNSDISLRDRAAVANAMDADLFVSIHANAAIWSSAKGIETYYLGSATDARARRLASEENAEARVRTSESEVDRLVNDLTLAGNRRLSRLLAHSIQESVITSLREVYGQEAIHDLGVKTARFYVLVFTDMPSVLYEASFLSHPEDELRLRQPQFQQISAEALVDGIESYLQQVTLR